MNTAEFSALATLELLTSECPSADLLGYAVRTLLASPARGDLVMIARQWGVEPDHLGEMVARVANALDAIERYRADWRMPRQVVTDPPPALALLQLARVRVERITGIARRRRLEVTIRKLYRAHQTELVRSRITRFIEPPAETVPVDISRWLSSSSAAKGEPESDSAA